MDDEQKQCMFCGKPATVHMTKIVDDQVQKMNLCEECSQTKGSSEIGDFSLSNLLVQAQSLVEQLANQLQGQVGQIICDSCGFSQTDFKKHGRFGCPECYKSFDPLLKPVLENIHKSATHRGKAPEHLLRRINLTQQLNRLKETLELAIQDERYEEAAELRDRIKKFEQAQKTADPSSNLC